MYQGNRYRSSFNNGGSQNNDRRSSSFGRPNFTRHTSNQRNFSNNRFGGGRGGNNHKSKLIGADINIFIKKSIPATVKTHINSTNSFSDFNLAKALIANIEHKGFTTPTPIQDQAIRPILEGRDLIGLASTGTGKTAAFLIPLINKIYETRDQRALIIAPTRELALQIRDEFKNLAWDMKLYSALVIGGANMSRQINDIRRNPHVVIATPGRLKDLVERNVIHLEDYKNIVLDEVDLMVDIGFIQDIKYFISRMPKVRQSLFFSATISPKIREVIDTFVTDPVTISLKKQDTSENVDQDVIRVIDKNKKIDQLHDLLIKDGFSKVLIFGETKHGIDKLHKELEFRGFKLGTIHGNKTQGARQRILDSFKRNEIQILLATDVASRGIDIDNVTHVINYDLPKTYEDYIHRIGRTGRANKTGTALTFV